MEFTNLTPPQLMERLAKNSRDIRKIGEKRTLKRNALIAAEAALMDAEATIWRSRVSEIKPTALEQEIKYGTVEEKKKVLIAKKEFQESQDEFEIVIEVNNSLKAFIRLREEELKHISYE